MKERINSCLFDRFDLYIYRVRDTTLIYLSLIYTSEQG